MNFGDLKERIKTDAWPNGVPENLTDAVDTYVLSGLIEAQRNIRCLQYRHDDVYAACQTYWHCGASAITAPKGRILRAYTIDNEEWCRPVPLRPVSMQEFRRWQAKWKSNWRSSYYEPPASGAQLPMGFDVPTTSSDAICGRATTGIYALDPSANRLWVGPWIQTTESLVVEWQGIKRTWSSGDIVPDDEDFIRLIRLFTELEFGRKWASDDLPIRERAYSEALADMMATCHIESQLHGEPLTAEEASAAIWSAFVPETPVTEDTVAADEIAIDFVGETGAADEDCVAVANAIAADEPDNVILLGNCKSGGNDAETAMAPYAEFTAAQTLKAALGNTDLDDGNLGLDVRTVANNPGNGRYYTVQYGPVSVFVINAGFNTAEGMVEPDGNFEGSRQFAEIMAAVVRDTNPWRVAVIHHPPYTSGDDFYPGTDSLRWVAELPVHAIVSARSANYERLTINSRRYFVVGTGGAPLRGFNETPLPGSQTRIDDEFGFLRLDADCDSAVFKFLDLDGNALDTVTIDTPAVPATPVMPLDPYITVQPASAAVVSGGSVTLSVTATGTAPLAYQWMADGVVISGATSSTYTIDPVTDPHTYRVLVSNPVSAVLSDAALVLPVTGTGSGIVQVADLATFVAGDYTSAAGIVLLLDDNDEPGYFTEAAASGSHDGVSRIVDSEGNHFVRIVFT